MIPTQRNFISNIIPMASVKIRKKNQSMKKLSAVLVIICVKDGVALLHRHL